MVRAIQAKTILSSIKPGTDTYFGLRYNMNLYRGCQHGCIYCDSRSSCYQLGDLSDIRMKDNALELLEKELKSKREKGTIGFGSMNDPYMPAEKEQQLTRKALMLADKYGFPVHIITKSNLVVRDIDVLKSISKKYAAISITITTVDDDLSKMLEPAAPVSSKRFEAIKELSSEGIYTGITLMPVIPFITDTEENIKGIVEQAIKAGAKYILAVMGMTLREGQREYFYNKLDKLYPTLKERYIRTYGDSYGCSVLGSNKLWQIFNDQCNKYGIKTRMEFYKPLLPRQMDLF